MAIAVAQNVGRVTLMKRDYRILGRKTDKINLFTLYYRVKNLRDKTFAAFVVFCQTANVFLTQAARLQRISFRCNRKLFHPIYSQGDLTAKVLALVHTIHLSVIELIV